MNRKTLNYLAILLAATMLLLASCNKEPQKLPGYNPASSAFVNAFTTGEISKNSAIRVHFTEAIADSAEIGKEASSALFSFKPTINGKAVWEDAYTLAFRPAGPLPSNQVFTADLKLDALFPENKQAKDGFAFHFKTRAQSFDVEWTGNESGGSGSSKWHNVRGRLVANDNEDPATITKLVEATYQGKPREIEWQSSAANGIYAFVVKNLERDTKENDLVLRVKGTEVGAENLTETVSIPSESDFILNRVLAINGSDQYITLEFSDPVDPKQRLEGLINIEGNDFSSNVDGNRIVLYPRQRLVGDLKVEVNSGILASNGKKTSGPVSKTVTMDSPKPQVALVKEGAIMPKSEKVPFLFKSVGLSKVDVRVIKVFEDNLPQFLQVNRLDGDHEMVRVGRIVAEKTIELDKKLNLKTWNTHSIDLSNIVNPEPGALYQVAVGFRQSYYVERCTGPEEEIPEWAMDNMPESMLDLPGNWDNGYGMPENSFWDYYYYYGNWEDREDPCKKAYYRSDRAVRQNILSSDLGIMVKRGDLGEALVIVTDLKSTQPVSGAKVRMLNYQQQVLAEGPTNADGFWKINLPKTPFLLTVQHGDQVGYLRLDDGAALSYSRFDVGGKTLEKGLKGFIYGERGVWRPGDPIYLTFMLQDREKSLPANHPVTFVLKNPAGQEVDRKVLTGGVDGFYAFETGTDSDAQTGSYTASIEVGGASFSKQLKVETVMPNRLKITFDVGEEGLKESQPEKTVGIKATWLHGAKAGGLKAKVQASLRPRNTSFTAWKGYEFDDPGKHFSPDEETFFDGTLDADGEARFPLKLSTNNEAPGMLNANFNTRVFERGGAASIDRFTTVFHPYQVYAGLKIPKGDATRGMLLTDTDHEMEIVTVDTEGKAVPGRNLKIEFFKINWRWWWDSGSDNLAAYLSRENNIAMQTDNNVTTNTKGLCKLNPNVAYPGMGPFLPAGY
ncbi:MAG: MG2 domain-containing protein [Bacteroidia bacterium]